MIVELNKVTFTNDFFAISLPDGSQLILNKVDEDFLADEGECVIKSINIEIQSYDGTVISCPCAIGIGNDRMKINTEHKEYEGDVLTPDNMAFCTIEVYEN